MCPVRRGISSGKEILGMRVIFLSANKLGLEVLKEVAKNKSVDIQAVITLAGDAKTVMYDGVDIREWYEFNAPVYEIKDIAQEKELILKLKSELAIICGWRQIIPKEILDIPTKGFVGFHPTLLPYGRGPAPIINSILLGLKESGVSMYRISEGIDDGEIIGQEKFTIDDNDYASDVYQKVIIASKKLINFYLHLLAHGRINTTKQDESKVFTFPKRSIRDNKIDLEKESAQEIYAKIRAFSEPYNGAYIEKDGSRLVIWRAELVREI